MPYIVICGACELEFELISGRDGQLCTCPRCFNQGRLKAAEFDKWKLKSEGEIQ